MRFWWVVSRTDDDLQAYSLRVNANVKQDISVSRIDPSTAEYPIIVTLIIASLGTIENSCGIVS